MASPNTTLENTTVSMETLPTGLRVTHSVCSLVIAFGGIVGNSITIFRMIRKTHPQQAWNLYLLNLSINNLISSSIILPLIGINSFFNGWIYGNTFCLVFAYFMYTNLCAEVNALILLTFNRFMKIVHPGTYPIIFECHRNNAIILICSWTLYSLLLLLPITGTWGQYDYDTSKNYCAIIRRDKFILFLSGSILVTSAPVIFFCYVSIFNYYRKSKRKIANIKKSTSQQKEPVAIFTPKELRLLRTILTVLVCFVLTYLPYVTLNLVDPKMEILGHTVHTACIYVSWLHVALNPIIYTLQHSGRKT